MIVGVHKEGADSDDFLETYTFKFTYMDERIDTCKMIHCGKSVRKVVEMSTDPKAVLHCAMQMMHGALYLVQTLEPLPGGVELSMKLLYYDEVTPADYEPPGFRPVEDAIYNFEGDPLNINIGKLSTPFHSLTFNCKTDSAKLDAQRKSSDSAENIDADDTETQSSFIWDDSPTEEIMPMQSEAWMSEQEKSEESDDCILPSQSPVASFSNLWQMSLKSKEPVTKEAAPVVSPEPPAVMDTTSPDEPRVSKCACGGDKEMGVGVPCIVCQTWSHAACYGFKGKSEIPRSFVCLRCHDETKGQLCADPKLLSLEPNQREEICLYRRVLVLCQEIDLISATKLIREMCVDRTHADKIMKHLESDNIVKRSKSKGSSRVLSHEMLRKNVLGQYFGSTATLGLDHKTGVEKGTGWDKTAVEKDSGLDHKTEVERSTKRSIFPAKETVPAKRRRCS